MEGAQDEEASRAVGQDRQTLLHQDEGLDGCAVDTAATQSVIDAESVRISRTRRVPIYLLIKTMNTVLRVSMFWKFK